MFEFLARLFRGEPSGAKAKERLRLVLLSDHLALAPDVVESLKTDLLEVISRYVEVDIEHVDVTFEQREHEVAMLANVPILSMKSPHERPRPLAAVAAPARNGVAREPAGGEHPQAEPASAEPMAAEPAEPGSSSEAPVDPGAEHVWEEVVSSAESTVTAEQAAASEPQATQPEAAQPEAAQPEAAQPDATEVSEAGSPRAEVIALPAVSAESAAAKIPRSRRRRRRKAPVNGTQSQQSKTGAMTQPHH